MYLNLALIVGSYEGLGYGESIGKLIATNGLDLPSKDSLMHCILNDKDFWRRSAASDLLQTIEDFELDTGRLEISHPICRFERANRLLTNWGSHLPATQ